MISINVSIKQFAQPGFEEMLFSAALEHGVSPELVELELTETVLASDDNALVRLLHRLKTADFS